MNTKLTFEERMTLLGALDTLAEALASHDHKWTEAEREIYEQALGDLGILDRDDTESTSP